MSFLLSRAYPALSLGTDLIRDTQYLKELSRSEHVDMTSSSKVIVFVFIYQNWLDPSKEIKKQIRGKW